MKFDTPANEVVDSEGNSTPAWTQFFNRLRNTCVWRTQYGTTAQRPTKNLEIGLPYYDTTLGFQICVHQVVPAVVWHSGAGAVV